MIQEKFQKHDETVENLKKDTANIQDAQALQEKYQTSLQNIFDYQNDLYNSLRKNIPAKYEASVIDLFKEYINVGMKLQVISVFLSFMIAFPTHFFTKFFKI